MDKETGTDTASATVGGTVGGPGTDLRTNEQIAAPAPPARGDRAAAAAADDPSVQHHDTGVESVTAPGDPRKQTRPSTNLPLSGETAGSSPPEWQPGWNSAVTAPQTPALSQMVENVGL